MKKNILWKYDSELGYAYFCPSCKVFICSHEEKCDKCGEKLNWDNKDEYKGKVKWN